jgi:hypothetical protein
MPDSQHPSSAHTANKPEVPAIRRIRRVKKLLSFLFSSTIIFCVLIALSLLYLRAQALPVTKMLQTTQILDANGEWIDSLYAGQNRQVI